MKVNWSIRAAVAAIIVLGLAGCGETTTETIAKWKAAGNVPKIIAAFTSPHQDVRLAAIKAVADLKAETAVAPLAGLLNDEDQLVVHKSIDAIAAIGGDAAKAEMMELLNYKTSEGRLVATKFVGNAKMKEAVDELIKLLNDEFETVATAAAVALGKIGDPKAIPPMAGKLQERSVGLKMACVESIRQIGGDKAAGALAPAMGDFSEGIRAAVVEAMVSIGDASAPYALEGLRSDGEFTRPAAAAILKGLGQEPKSGDGLVWYTLAKIPQDKKLPVDPALVSELAAIDGAIDPLLEAAYHPTEKVNEYADQALFQIGEPAAAATAAAAEQHASREAKTWFAGRSTWAGAPSWRLDLWGGLTALNPHFSINPPKVKTLQNRDEEARTLLASKNFKPTVEYTPLFILQTATQEDLGDVRKNRNAAKNKPLAEKRLIKLGKATFHPLVAGLDDEDPSIADSCAKVLVRIDKATAQPLVVEAFTRKVEAGANLAGTGFLKTVTLLEDPAVEPLLAKIRPNNERAIQVFEETYPGIQVSIIPLPPADPHPTAEPFRLKYVKGGRTKELRVIFRKGADGVWLPETMDGDPLPTKLP